MGKKKKVYVTPTFPPEIIPGFDSYVEKLEFHGFEVILEPSNTRVPKDELIKKMKGVYALVSGSEILTEEVFAACPSLKIVSRMGAGWDEMDIDAGTKWGVAIATSPGANAEAVAEQALALLLALNRKILYSDRMVREGKWDKVFGTTLYRQTLGIIGMGAIGKVLTKLVSGFDMKVLAYDICPDEDFARKSNVEYCHLERLLSESDFVSVNCLLNESTYHMIGDIEFSLMKPDARFINCARGAIVDEAALYRALTSGKIAGAGLDAFTQEPINMDNPLLGLDNVIMSPHTAGMTYGGRGKVIDMAFQNVIDLTEGILPRGFRNPEVLNNPLYISK